jgi:hypothetical protein
MAQRRGLFSLLAVAPHGMAPRRCAAAANHDIVLRQIDHIFKGLPVERWFPGLTMDHS